MLTARQERFCQEYVIDMDGAKAAIRAGYSVNTAKEQASRLLTKVNVKKLLAKLQENMSNNLGITAEMVVSELWALGKYSIQDLVDDEQALVNLKTTDRKILIPIVGLKTTERWTAGDMPERIVTTEIKLSDKISALEKVGKHLGIFEKDNTQKKDDITVNINRASGKR